MNPKGIDDLTIELNFQIDIGELDDECQKKVRLAFGDSDNIESLPFTLYRLLSLCTQEDV